MTAARTASGTWLLLLTLRHTTLAWPGCRNSVRSSGRPPPAFLGVGHHCNLHRLRMLPFQDRHTPTYRCSPGRQRAPTNGASPLVGLRPQRPMAARRKPITAFAHVLEATSRHRRRHRAFQDRVLLRLSDEPGEGSGGRTAVQFKPHHVRARNLRVAQHRQAPRSASMGRTASRGTRTGKGRAVRRKAASTGTDAQLCASQPAGQ